MKVATDQSNEAFAGLHVNMKKRSDLPTPSRGLLYADEIEDVTMATKIINPPAVVKDGILSEAFFLAKEHITHMFFIGMAQEYYRIVLQSQFRFIDFDQNLITDPELIKKAGEATFVKLTQRGSSDWMKLWDMLPAMILASPAWELRAKEKLPKGQEASVGGFYEPGQYFSTRPDQYNQLENIRNQWMRSQTFLPPTGIVDVADAEPMRSYMINYRKKIMP